MQFLEHLSHFEDVNSHVEFIMKFLMKLALHNQQQDVKELTLLKKKIKKKNYTSFC